MVRVLHVLDESAPEDAARLASLLLRTLGERAAGKTRVNSLGPLQGRADSPQDRANVLEDRADLSASEVVVIGHTPAALRMPHESKPLHAGRRFNLPLASVLDLKRIFERYRPDVVHALDPFSSAAVGALRAAFPAAVPALVTTLCDPADAPRVAKWHSALGGLGAGRFICNAQLVQRRLVEAGVPLDATTVIRPGVDFGEILAAKRSMARAALGLPTSGRVLLTPSQPSRAGGHFYAIWATAILNQIWPDVRLIVPGTSREAMRVRRLASQINCPEAYVFTGDRCGPAELLAVADMLIAPALDDVSTGWLAWAMAAGVPITGSAIPCITEFIADRHNGFLCRQHEPHTLAARIRLAFSDDRLLRKCVEAARSQAYDAFSAVACAEAYAEAFREAASGGVHPRERGPSAVRVTTLT